MDRLKRLLAMALAAVTLLSLASCGLSEQQSSSSQPSEEPVDINYPLDFEGVYIEEMPVRVVSLSPALTEIVCELGYEDRLVGRTDYCDYPSSVSSLKSVGTVLMPDIDAIAQLNPDLIIMQAPPTDEALTKMQQTGAALVTLARAYDLESTADLYAKVFTLMEGAEVGVEKGALYKAQFLRRINNLTDAIKRTVEGMTDAPSYTGAYIVDTTSIVATPDTYEGKLLAVLGLENVASEGANWQFSHEKLTAAKPYVLLCGSDIDVTTLAKNKRLGEMSAVKKERAYAVNSVIFERQSPHLAEELERLAKEIYPDLVLDTQSASSTELAPEALGESEGESSQS